MYGRSRRAGLGWVRSSYARARGRSASARSARSAAARAIRVRSTWMVWSSRKRQVRVSRTGGAPSPQIGTTLLVRIVHDGQVQATRGVGRGQGLHDAERMRVVGASSQRPVKLSTVPLHGLSVACAWQPVDGLVHSSARPAGSSCVRPEKALPCNRPVLDPVVQVGLAVLVPAARSAGFC